MVGRCRIFFPVFDEQCDKPSELFLDIQRYCVNLFGKMSARTTKKEWLIILVTCFEHILWLLTTSFM